MHNSSVPPAVNTLGTLTRFSNGLSVSKPPETKAKPWLGRKEIGALIGSGAVALVCAFVISALQFSGLIDMGLAHLFLVLAWFVAVLAVLVSETLLARPAKHAIIVLTATATIMAGGLFALDRWMVTKKREQDRIVRRQTRLEAARLSHANNPSLEEPTFTEDVKEVNLILGGNKTHIPVDALEHGFDLTFPVGSKNSNGEFATLPVHIVLEKGKLYVDAEMFGYQNIGQPVVTMKRNKITSPPSDWDMNKTQDALEIVDQKQRPVFQLVYERHQSQIKVNGIFRISDIVYLCDENGLLTISEEDISEEGLAAFELKPLFEYPSWQYPGVYAIGDE